MKSSVVSGYFAFSSMVVRQYFHRVSALASTAGLALGACLLLAGCASGPAFNDSARIGPFFKPHNYHGDTVLPASLHRVLLLPVYAGNVTEPESAVTLDAILLSALQKQARFEVVSLSRAECQQRFGAPEFSSVAALPHGLLDELARDYAVEAVLFVDLTEYRPYRPLGVGFRAKLATVQDVHLIWSFDEAFSATSPEVENSVRHYYIAQSAGNPSVDMTASALQSPSRFAAYAADAMFGTLPPR
jgi:hypothetical protein